MNLINQLYDWGARRETLSVQPNYKNIQTLRELCDEAADALVDTNRRIYALATGYFVSGEMKTYEDLKQILKYSDPAAYQLLLEQENQCEP